MENKKKEWNDQRGSLYLADLNPAQGSEQGGIRPVLVIQNNIGNAYGPTLIVAPLTTRMKKRDQPTHVYLRNVKGLDAPSIVELEQIKTIDKGRVQGYLGRLSAEQMMDVNRALCCSLGLEMA